MQSFSSPFVSTVPRLHVITAPNPSQDEFGIIEAVLDAGAPCLQIRAKHLTDDALLRFATSVVERCHAAGARCLINDRVDIALASGADGVHLGADDLPVAAARRLAGDDFLIGATVRDPATARRLASDGADYLGVGPIHATETKAGLPPPLGLDGLRPVIDVAGIPVLGIGGITVARAQTVLASGAFGIAVVGAVYDAQDPAAAVRALLEITDLHGRSEDGR